jgi:uncharacterized protein YndB with AHSA1/START domain
MKEGMTMTEHSIVHSTFVIERNYPQSPDRVWAAFAQPERKRRWYAEGDHETQEFEMEFKVRGNERHSYRFKDVHPLAGQVISNEGTFHVISSGECIVSSSTMSLNGKPILVSLLTMKFVPNASGTDLIFTEQGAFFDWPDGPKMLEAGWRALFQKLETYLAAK